MSSINKRKPIRVVAGVAAAAITATMLLGVAECRTCPPSCLPPPPPMCPPECPTPNGAANEPAPATPPVSDTPPAPRMDISVPIEKEIEWQGTIIGVVERLTVPVALDELSISVVLRSDLLSLLDRILSEKGDLEKESWSKRVYWKGRTKPRHGGSSLALQSVVTIDVWTKIDLIFDEIKTRLFEMTRTVYWIMEIPASEIHNLHIIAKLTNIKDFPGWVERELDLTFSKTFNVPLPVACGSCRCRDLSNDWDAKLTKVYFEIENGDIRLIIDLEADVDWQQAVACLVD